MYRQWKSKNKEAYNRANELIQRDNEDEMQGRLVRLNKEIEKEKNYLENMLELCAIIYIAEVKMNEEDNNL